MFKFVLFSSLAMMAAAQSGNYHGNPQTAAILSEQRYLTGDGKFGSAYTQEDGTDFKEETEADGTRRGSYSYVDPTGQRRTISYTAGKNGFQASGDHLPVAPPAPAVPAPQQQYQQQPRYQAQPQQSQFGSSGFGNGDNYEDGQYDPRYNDPSFSQGSNYRAPAPAPVQQPQQPQYQQPQPQYNQPQQNYNQIPQQQYTTQNPHRFQPPGKLSLNRTPDGYSYSFSKA